MALTISRAKPITDFEYVPLAEKLESAPFTVLFSAIPLDTLAKLQDAALSVSKDGEYNISINSLNHSVLKLALTGWKNIGTEDAPIRFKRDSNGASDGSLTLIPGDIRSEIATIIIEVSKDLPNAEEYLAELNKLAMEDVEDEDEQKEAEPEVVVEKPKRARKKTA